MSRMAKPVGPSPRLPDLVTTSGLDRVGPHRSRCIHIDAQHGFVQFFLQRVAGGLYVEREDIPGQGLRVMQLVQFADADSFDQWCDDDPLRFEHPLLHVQLKREGDALWRTDATCRS